jgi:hypothetical protein
MSIEASMAKIGASKALIGGSKAAPKGRPYGGLTGKKS